MQSRHNMYQLIILYFFMANFVQTRQQNSTLLMHFHGAAFPYLVCLGETQMVAKKSVLYTIKHGTYTQIKER